jgi:membrane peptidoglycan carboxypeptidase
VIAAMLLLLAGVAVFGWLWFTVEVPEPNDFATSQATIVTYSGDREEGRPRELGRFSTENRVAVPLSEIPEELQQAVVAAEDRTFYENRGISPTGIARAAWNNLRGGELQGASTITQQYVKNFYLSQDQTFDRKITEIILALKIDATRSKQQILEDYLNTIYFGRGAYGVETAAQAWFREPVRRVNLEQSVVLASVIQSPSLSDPATGGQAAADRLQNRADYVLDGMVALGFLDEATAATTEIPEIAEPRRSNALTGPRGHVLAAVREELLALGFTPADIDSGGLRVETTIDRQAQQAAVDAVREEFPTIDAQGVHVGLAAVEPGSGAIRAMYGGPNYVDEAYNYATQGWMQGASTFKAFTLAAGLEEGISLDSQFSGNSPFVVESDLNPATREIRNEGGRSFGEYIDLRTATANSVNTAFVDLTMTVGPDRVVDALERAGVPTERPDGTPTGLEANSRVTLGTAVVTPLVMANAYATLAAEGVAGEPYLVQRVSRADGQRLYRAEPEVRDAFDPLVTADVTSALRGVVEFGSGTRALALGRPAAGKTGTAGEEGITGSSWFAGYTPQLAAAVGFCRYECRPSDDLDGVGGLPTFFGGEYPARIWTAFMIGAMEGLPVEELQEPAFVGEPLIPTPTETPTPTPTETPSPTREPEGPPASPEPEPEPEPEQPEQPEQPGEGEQPPDEGDDAGSGDQQSGDPPGQDVDPPTDDAGGGPGNGDGDAAPVTPPDVPQGEQLDVG